MEMHSGKPAIRAQEVEKPKGKAADYWLDSRRESRAVPRFVSALAVRASEDSTLNSKPTQGRA